MVLSSVVILSGCTNNAASVLNPVDILENINEQGGNKKTTDHPENLKPLSEFEHTFEYNGSNCTKGELAKNSDTDMLVPFASYICRRNDNNQILPSGSLIKFAGGNIIRLEYSAPFIKEDRPVKWEKSSLKAAPPSKYNDDYWFAETFSGGAHCCFSAYIVDINTQEITDVVAGGSVGFTKKEHDGTDFLHTLSQDFEYFWGPYIHRVLPPVYYKIDDQGKAQMFNAQVGDKIIQKDIDSLRNMMNHLMSEDRLTSRSDLCLLRVDLGDRESCMGSKREARVIAAITATYLMAGKDHQAEEYFKSQVEWNEANKKNYQDIIDTVR